MKKYSSYIDLKIAYHAKQPAMKSPKNTAQPSFKKVMSLQNQMIPLLKEVIPSSSKAKYSAAYLQRKKIFSNKKENKDNENTKNYTKQIGTEGIKQKIMNIEKKVEEIKKNNDSKSKKTKQDKKQKTHKNKETLEIDTKEVKSKARLDIQSPKGQVIKDQKQKSKIKEKTVLAKKQKKQPDLKEFVTSYEMDKKQMLVQCTSEANLVKPVLFEKDKKIKQDYYIHSLINAFFNSSKPSSFQQICKNHLLTSIDFLVYIKKNKKIIPNKVKSLNLSFPTKPTIVFDLDQTLIHCNQSLDLPHDITLPITFPNGQQIKAGINIRPFAQECIKQLSQYFELILFTASHECYANVIVDYLDPEKKYFAHRYFRESCHRTDEGFYVKDLRIFDRNLENVLLVDNAAYSYCFQPENGVPIIPFYNNKTDFELKGLTTYLKDFKGVKDMRTKNEKYMKLAEYHKFKNPKQLINQLYM